MPPSSARSYRLVFDHVYAHALPEEIMAFVLDGPSIGVTFDLPSTTTTADDGGSSSSVSMFVDLSDERYPMRPPAITVDAASDERVRAAAERAVAALTHERNWSPAIAPGALLVALHADVLRRLEQQQEQLPSEAAAC
jgi:hypothetical protein